MIKLNDTQVSKVVRFLEDEVMSDSVKEIIIGSFLKAKTNQDVYQLAASRIAINLLEDAWKDLDKYRLDIGEEGDTKKTPHV